MAKTKSSLSLSLLSSIFATVAFFLTWSSIFNCNFVQFTIDQNTGLSLGFGLWSHSFYTISSSLNGSIIFEACIRYGSTTIDTSMKAARIFSLLALGLGGTFFFVNIISACVTPNKRLSGYTRSEGVAYLLTSLFQGLSLLLLNNSATVCTNNPLINKLQSEIDAREHVQIEFDDTCAISTGARCCIAAIVFWFLAGLASCQATSAARKEENDGRDNLRDPLIDSIL